MNKIYVVGIGPGEYEGLTIKAEKVLKEVDVIIGYTVYVDLVKEHFADKEFITTPMRKEQERCRLAFEEALKGKKVAMICSGDAGVYGMSGLMLELSKDYEAVEVEVLAGVSAVLSGAALLGAPLIHDFCVISLSDLLTPWELIETRLKNAALGDFAISLYNPSSKKRADYLSKACDILLEYKDEKTPCAVVSNIGREGEHYEIMSLLELKSAQTDMFCTVFIGNSNTKIMNNKLVTPRGYKITEKYE